MQIDVVDNMQRLMELKVDWEAVYDADPEAQFFLSWSWMVDWLPRVAGPWFVLAARPVAASPYVAFLPLRLGTEQHNNGSFYNEINFAGNYAADYAGFVCRPEAERDAIPAFGRAMMRLNWTNLRLDNFAASEHRLRLFLNQFPSHIVVTKQIPRINAPDNVDNCICPFVPLPNDWDQYLSERVSANTRQKIRRVLRQVEGSSELRIALADAQTIERSVDILLRFWAARWSERKGKRIHALVRNNRTTLLCAFASGALLLPVLWKGEMPLGALATFIDERKKALLFYLSGRDESFNTPPPGLVLHAWSIRHAIERGFRVYDFLRGNEPYKYSFGAEERHIKCIRISTRTGRNLGDRLDLRSIPEALDRATKLHEAGKLQEAECGYRQVLDVTPRDATALYRFAQLMATKGNHAAAKRLFKTLTELRPDAYKAWLGLAKSLQARGRFAEAAHAYREVIKLRPEIGFAHRNLGDVLTKLGRDAEAASAFGSAKALGAPAGPLPPDSLHAVE
jgi:tetratricopeptide (TPR) repeat protein